MKQVWSTSWKSSKNPRKQRKYRYNAPMHIRDKFMSAELSKELRKKYGRRSIQIKKGDKAKVTVGEYKGKEAVVARTSVKNTKVYLEGMDLTKVSGAKVGVSFDPSNLMITELNLKDKKREQKLMTNKPKEEKKA